MSIATPIPRQTRQSIVTASAAQTTFGPFDFPLFDEDDVQVRVKAAAETEWTLLDVDDFAVHIAPPATAYPALFSVTLVEGRTAGDLVWIKGARLPSRETNVVRAGKLQSVPLEAELDVQAATQQELRRDIDALIAGGAVHELIASGVANDSTAAGGTVADALADLSTRTGAAEDDITDIQERLGEVEGQVLSFPNRAAVVTAIIPASASYVRIAGYTSVGDIGGALYRKVDTEPSHDGKIQSADGAWWEIVEPVLYPQMFGGSLATAIAVATAIGSRLVATTDGVAIGAYGLPLTHSDEHFSRSIRNSDTTALDVYRATYPAVSFSDALQGVMDIPGSATIIDAAGIAGYVKNASGPTNGVAVRGVGIATVTDAKVWGINTLLMDNATRATHARTGQVLLGAELDFNVMGTGTQVIGVSVGGNSLAQPTNAIGYIVNTLGNGNKWQTGFFVIDGAVSEYGLALGPPAVSGTSIGSLKILQQYFNAASAKKAVTMQASNNAWSLTSDDTSFTAKIGGSIAPTVSGGGALGLATLPWSDLYLGLNGAINWAGGDVVITQSANALAFGGAAAGYSFDARIVPGTNDGAALGSTTLQWSDLFLASGAVLNFSNGNVTVTHSAGALSVLGANYVIPEWNAASADCVNILFRKSRGSSGAKAIVSSGDAIGKFNGQGYNGTGYDTAAQISFEVDGTPGASSDMPGRIAFWTSPDGTATPTLRGTFHQDGSFVLGDETSALATNATGGFLYVRTCAGTPTGVPTARAGAVPLVYDTTNNKLAVYNGAWKQTAALT